MNRVIAISREFGSGGRTIGRKDATKGCCVWKKKYPKTGSPLTYMGEFTGLYYVTFKEYIADYRIHGDVIEIARVLFSRSDYMKVLFGKSEYLHFLPRG